ncbi:hypothetical protein IAE22_32065, partial [Bacillus sp. S34]|nr:hypothetical protein [Bacillus sp. S34]
RDVALGAAGVHAHVLEVGDGARVTAGEEQHRLAEGQDATDAVPAHRVPFDRASCAEDDPSATEISSAVRTVLQWFVLPVAIAALIRLSSMLLPSDWRARITPVPARTVPWIVGAMIVGLFASNIRLLLA